MNNVAMIRLTNVINAASAEPIKRALHGKSYMDLEVLVCPAGGSLDIMVQTRKGYSQEELTGMVLTMLCEALPE